MKHGFIKVAAAAPEGRVADTAFNTQKITDCVRAAAEQRVRLLLLPELCLTGATCGDLYRQQMLLDGAAEGLRQVARATAGLDMLVVCGLPAAINGRLYSVAAVLYDGTLLGLVPRTEVRGTGFAEPDEQTLEVSFCGFGTVPLGTELLFESRAVAGLRVAVQFSADAKQPVPPAVRHAAAGATLIAELSDEPVSTFSARRTARVLRTDSGRLCCAWLSAAPGSGESTTDRAYAGLCMAVENGTVVASRETGTGMLVTELDNEYVLNARCGAGVFRDAGPAHTLLHWGGAPEEARLTRPYSKTPFLPEKNLDEFCERALEIQALGIMKRVRYTGCEKLVVGVSGGVDSTLVMLACCRALDRLGLPRKNLVAVTMPCFGTTERTKSNAITVAEKLGATVRVIPIADSVMAHFRIIGHDYDNKNVVFENAQARERTMVLMDIANEIGGMDIGTKDLSEQADGWTTFNGDQISNYDANAGLTKTMVKAVVRYIERTCGDPELADALRDINDTPVTPELLPISESGELLQKSEDSVGPYILQDFFTWHMVMRGGTPEKVLRLAEYAFAGDYDRETIRMWLGSYCRRLFVEQFKRSCSADGPAVMGFTFSPRDGYKMPSDGEQALWMDAVERLKD